MQPHWHGTWKTLWIRRPALRCPFWWWQCSLRHSSSPNNKHWFTTSFLQPQSGGRCRKAVFGVWALPLTPTSWDLCPRRRHPGVKQVVPSKGGLRARRWWWQLWKVIPFVSLSADQSPWYNGTGWMGVPGISCSKALWEMRWPSCAGHPNEPYGFRGRKAILNHAHALVSSCP